jgi:hypothetical protein
VPPLHHRDAQSQELDDKPRAVLPAGTCTHASSRPPPSPLVLRSPATPCTPVVPFSQCGACFSAAWHLGAVFPPARHRQPHPTKACSFVSSRGRCCCASTASPQNTRVHATQLHFVKPCASTLHPALCCLNAMHGYKRNPSPCFLSALPPPLSAPVSIAATVHRGQLGSLLPLLPLQVSKHRHAPGILPEPLELHLHHQRAA